VASPLPLASTHVVGPCAESDLSCVLKQGSLMLRQIITVHDQLGVDSPEQTADVRRPPMFPPAWGQYAFGVQLIADVLLSCTTLIESYDAD
jgi:hypothetical protein